MRDHFWIVTNDNALNFKLVWTPIAKSARHAASLNSLRSLEHSPGKDNWREVLSYDSEVRLLTFAQQLFDLSAAIISITSRRFARSRTTSSWPAAKTASRTSRFAASFHSLCEHSNLRLLPLVCRVTGAAAQAGGHESVDGRHQEQWLQRFAVRFKCCMS